MIYTYGRTNSYELWMKKHPDLQKDIGGSVWETKAEAEDYLQSSGQEDLYSVYGVDADWDADTTEAEQPDATWRELTRPSPLNRLKK